MSAADLLHSNKLNLAIERDRPMPVAARGKMSRYDKKQSRGRSNATESAPPPLPQLKADPQSSTEESALESLIGNAALADAATKDPLTTQNDLLQSSYGNAAVANALVQRKPEGEDVPGVTPAAGEEQQSTEEQPATGAAAAPAAGLIVEDSAETIEPGQMRKSDFLSQLRASVSSTAAEALADTQWSEAGCPYIDQWFAYYNAQDSQHVEQAIRRYAREAAGATAASSYIPIVTGRVRRSITTWVTTGEVTGLPEGGPGLPGGGAMGAVGGVASGIASAASGVVAGVGSALSAAGSILFKEREGGAKEADDPQAIQAQLGAGQSLDGGVKSRMESAYGESFSGVQVHTDANAARVSSNLNARALTVGNQIAFAAGEYQPGTLIGDALIAHELAHVMQQRSGEATQSPAQKGAGDYDGLEEDADRAAVGAVVSLWGKKSGKLAAIGRNAMPGLKSGLKLQRCKGGGSSKSKPQEPQLLTDFAAKFPDSADLVRNNTTAMTLVKDADTAGAAFGGYAEDGPAHDSRAYTIAATKTVYVPRGSADKYAAMSGFLFELNNAIHSTGLINLEKEAGKGSTGTLTAEQYANGKAEIEVDGMLRTGGAWADIKQQLGGGTNLDQYDAEFYLTEYQDFAAHRKTKADIVNDLLSRVYPSGVNSGKTVKQFYIQQYNELSGGR